MQQTRILENHMKRKLIPHLLSLCLATGALASTTAHAQAYPNKPVKIVVPYAAGGGGDVLARLFGDKLRVRLGQPVLVENRAGAGTLIGSEFVAKSPADGYTLLLTTNTLVIAPILNASAAKFDPIKDFAPVVPIASIAIVMVAHPAVPANNAGELIAYLKKNPDKLSFGSSGTGGITHLAAELFKTRAGVAMTHVPYKGAAPALTDLMAGQINVFWDAMITANPHIKSGKIKALGMANAKRWDGAPEIPTIAESGLPGYEVSGWYGVLAPAGTPNDVLQRLNNDSVETIKEPTFAAELQRQGLIPMGGSVDNYRKIVAADSAMWANVIKSANIKID